MNIFSWIGLLLLIGWLVGAIGFGEALGTMINLILFAAILSLFIALARGVNR